MRYTLSARGYRYRLHWKHVVGTPDLAFTALRVALFIDGDFWHGRSIQEDGIDAFRATLRTDRREWWVKKIHGNVTRDLRVTRALRASGWSVIRLWESRVLANPGAAANLVERVLRRRARARGAAR